MHPYSCHRARDQDMPGLATLCEDTQAELWQGIRPRIKWDTQLVAYVVENRIPLVAESGGNIIGALILAPHPPQVKIIGWATSNALTHRQRIGVSLSLLLAAYPLCVTQGITEGSGQFLAGNKVILDTLNRIGLFNLQLVGVAPRPSPTYSLTPHVYRVTVTLGDDLRAALQRTLDTL